MSRNRFNINSRSASVSLANAVGAREQEPDTPKTLTTYLGLLYLPKMFTFVSDADHGNS
ncbi:MAG: hypothetical protein RLZZ338_1837 [Cyanobacteriota bacterium]|jgi:hypothetical protein